MFAKHPVIAVTGSAARGLPPPASRFVKYSQLNLHAAEVEGDSFTAIPPGNGDPQSARRRAAYQLLGPEANDFGLLEQTFEYGPERQRETRKYLHTYDEAVRGIR